MKAINEEIINAIMNCVDGYKDEEGFEENLGDTLHENLSSQGIHAEDEEEFAAWEKYAYSFLRKIEAKKKAKSFLNFVAEVGSQVFY